MTASAGRPLPLMLPEAREFWKSAAEGRLALQFCTSCEQYVYYPRVLCPRCFEKLVEWRTVSGRGFIVSFAIARRATVAELEPLLPYVIAIVELDEGPRMTALLVRCRPEDARIGMRVRAAFAKLAGDVGLVDFEPACEE